MRWSGGGGGGGGGISAGKSRHARNRIRTLDKCYSKCTLCSHYKYMFPKEYVCTGDVSNVMGKYTLYQTVAEFGSSMYQ